MTTAHHLFVSRARAILLAAVLGACAGCAATESAPQWRSSEFSAASENVVWQVTVLALEKEGFPLGAGLDPTTLIATSGWQTSLAPFMGEGWRAQAQVKYERVAPGRFKVDVRVKKEVNEDMVRPLDISFAKWKPDADDVDRAEILLQRIKSYLGQPLEVGTKPKRGTGR